MGKSTPIWAMARDGHFGVYAPMLTDDIRANIVRLRAERDWSRPDLAKAVKPKTSPQQIERLEKGERKLTIEWVERIAAAFNISPAELMTGEASASHQITNLTIDESVADEAARTFGRVALGEEPADSLVKDLSAMLRELCETFARHPATRRDPERVQPVVDLLARRFVTQ